MNIVYLIPYYNAYDDLLITLDSLLEEIDVLIVDDGSHIPLTARLDIHAYNFTIEVITAPHNMGIEGALNLGLQAIYPHYTHVARIDCGDVCSPKRIATQKQYFMTSPETILVGSWARFVDDEYRPLFISEMPTDYEEIQRQMFVNNMFIHPSVMMDLQVVEELGGYPLDRKAAEDYALFYKMLPMGTCINIAQPLIDYVVAQNSISSQKRTRQILSRIRVMLDHNCLHWRWVYGLGRSICLLMIPRGVTTILRKFIKVY